MTEEKKYSIEFYVRQSGLEALKDEFIDGEYEDEPELEQFVRNVVKCDGKCIYYFNTYEEYQHLVKMIYTVSYGECEVFNLCTAFEW